QRVVFQAKVAVLIESLARTGALLWIDDFDLLEDAVARAERDPAPLRYLLEGNGPLAGTGGRLLIVSTRPPPASGFRAVEIASLDDETSLRMWRRFGGPELSSGDGLPAWCGRTPVALRLIARAASRLDAAELRAVRDATDPFEAAFEASVAGLGQLALSVLESAVALRRDPRRQAIVDVIREALPTVEPALSGPASPLLELESSGLAEAPDGSDRDAPAVSIPRRIRELVERRVRRVDPGRWEDLQRGAGVYFARLAGRSSNPWHSLASWRALSDAGRHDGAYEVQKTFIEEILRRGYLDMAAWILRRTADSVTGIARSVTLGNLAITYKNAGDLDRALETYQVVRGEFEEAGDLQNVARVLHQIGNVQYLRRDHGAALEAYRRSLELSGQLGETAVNAATRIQIANLQYQANDVDGALEEYRRALADTAALGAHHLQAIVALQVAQIHQRRHEYLEAEEALAQAESAAQDASDLRSLVKIYQAQGMLAARRREYDAARSRYEDAMRVAEQLGDYAEVASTRALAGDLELGRSQPAEALADFLRARSLLGSDGARGA
ncbi:MAG: tetratricopeptide repeat protein, partial [Candidatus Methanoperedens sp.]|nr:tetratricopeptide repeat protein [Candidatus Methanoperedens sp.]